MHNKNVYLFGASSLGLRAYNDIKERYCVQGFIDNDKKKWGKTFVDDKKIIFLDEIKDLDNNDIVVASTYSKEICRQLESMGCMEYGIYPSLEYSNEARYEDKALCQRVDSAFLRLHKKFMHINIENLDISDYNKRYLGEKGAVGIFRYSDIIYSILSSNPNTDYFLDYGGGTGLLSLLAIECGVKNVYYNDIYDVSCVDAEKIAEAMGYRRKGYVCGDIDKVIEFAENSNILFDAVGSYDVLEHVYDVEQYFLNLKKILRVGSVVCKETAANSFNEKKKEEFAIFHIKSEFMDRPKIYGHKERDSLKSFYKIRLETIEKYLTENKITLKEAEVIALAFLTRGMIQGDTIKAVDKYILNGELPVFDTYFEYNTCDPITGNWAEHILDYDKLTKYLQGKGFSVSLNYDGAPENSYILQLLLKVVK